MNEVNHGEGWWQASDDDQWYPPESHPNYRPPPPVRATVPTVEPDVSADQHHPIDALGVFGNSSAELPPQKHRRRLMFGVLIGVLVLALGVTGLVVSLGGPPEKTISGTFTLNQTRDSQGSAYQAGYACFASSGYTDIAAGTQVQVNDASGKLLGFGSLGNGKAVLDPSGNQVFRYADAEGNSRVADSSDLKGYAPQTDCTFDFTVTDVPQVSLYQVEVSHRGQQSYSLGQMQQSGWIVGLQLGNSEPGQTATAPTTTTTTTTIPYVPSVQIIQNYVGMTEPNASAAIGALGGTITTTPVATCSASQLDTILSQNPAPGTRQTGVFIVDLVYCTTAAIAGSVQ